MRKKNKGKAPDPRIARYKPKEKSQEEPHFWTADGRKVRIKTISFFDVKEAELNIRKEFEDRTKPPTYQTVTAGGVVREHELTEKILIVDDDQQETERRQSAWAEYQKALAEMQGEISKATLSLIMEGINETPEDELWIATRKKRHLSIPPEDFGRRRQVAFLENRRTAKKQRGRHSGSPNRNYDPIVVRYGDPRAD